MRKTEDNQNCNLNVDESKPKRKRVKLSLTEKQQIKLDIQKKKNAERLNKSNVEETKNRFYCTNKELHNELLKWRNSDTGGLPVLKLVNDQLIETETFDTLEQHEVYSEGTKYFVKLPILDKNSVNYNYVSKLYTKARKQLKTKNKLLNIKIEEKFYDESNLNYVLHEVTDVVKYEGWAFNYDNAEERVLSDELGNMIIAIGDKLLNHNSFRNYDQELKLDMRGQFFIKLIKGLKNYNFKFNNPFAFFTTCAWNSFLTVINQHYKHQNIRKMLMEKLIIELQTYSGISQHAGLSKYINSYLENDIAYEN